KPSETVDAVCGAKQNQLNSTSSRDACGQHQSRSDLPLNIQAVLYRVGHLQLRIEYLEDVGPLRFPRLLQHKIEEIIVEHRIPDSEPANEGRIEILTRGDVASNRRGKPANIRRVTGKHHAESASESCFALPVRVVSKTEPRTEVDRITCERICDGPERSHGELAILAKELRIVQARIGGSTFSCRDKV